MSLLTVNQLSVHFGEKNVPFKAVDRISYRLNQGEVLGIVEESGSGKSVSSLAVMGLIDYPGHVSAETLFFDNKDLLKLNEKAKRKIIGVEIAMIFQDPMTGLNPSYTVGFQIMEALKVHQGGSKKERRERALELLKMVGIPDPQSRLTVYPHQLSSGMSQRVMIAIAIACKDRPPGCLLNPRCPYVTEKCREIEPHLWQSDNRRVKCHYPLDVQGNPTYE